jgi:outer membrane protein
MRILFFFVLAIGTVLSSYAQTQQPAVKIGYVDTEYILSVTPEAKVMQEQLKTTQSKLQSDFTAKQQLFQKQYADYSANMNSMADTARARTEDKLQQMSQELQQFQQDAQSTLENVRKLHMAPIYLKVGKTIDEVAQENGFTIILPKQVSGLNLLLYADKKMDISDLVMQKLGIVPDQKSAVPPTKKQ